MVELATENLAALPVDWVHESFAGVATPTSVWDRGWLVMALAQLGRFAEATGDEAEAIRLAESTHRAYPVGVAYRAAGTLHTLKGDWLKARPRIENGLAVARTGNADVLLPYLLAYLDLSKIEAGRMELELADFDLPTAIDNALMLVRERAGRRSLTLHKSVDAGVGQLQAYKRKIRQVVLNLLSNAIKFTPEGERIEVRATPQDGMIEAVSDTGVGIAPEDQEAVLRSSAR